MALLERSLGPNRPVRPLIAMLVLAVAAAAAVGPYWSKSTSLLLSDLILYFPSLYASLPAMWDPMVQGGTPLLPNPQAGWFYPPAWLLRGDLQGGLPWYIFGHLLLAGLAAWAWVRTRLGDGLEPLLAGVVYIASGPTLSLFLTPDKLPGHAALPVLLLGLHWMLGDDRPRRRGVGWGVGVAAIAMAWLGGSVEAIFIAAIAGPAWAFGLPGAAPDSRSRLLRAAAAVGVLAVGSAVAACLLVPLFELLPETARSGRLPLAEALHRSTHPVDWIGWCTPNPFWEGEDLRYVLDDAGTSRARWLRTVYGGCLLAPLLVGLAVCRKRGPGAAVAAVGLAGFVFLALGDLNPLKQLLHLLPGIGSMRYPDKWWLGTVAFQAWLAALGLRAVRTDPRAARAAVLVLGGLGLAGVGGLFATSGGPLIKGAQALSTALAFVGVGGAVLIGWARGRSAPGWLLVAVFAADLLVAGAGAFPRADGEAARERPAAVAAIRADWTNNPNAARSGPPRIWDESQHNPNGRLPDFPHGEGLRKAQREVLSPNIGTEHGLAYIDGMRALRMARQSRFSAILEDLDPISRRQLLRSVGTDYWVTYGQAEAIALVYSAGLRPVAAAPAVPLEIGVLAEPDPLPRLRLVGRWQEFPDDAAAYRYMQERTEDVVATVAGDPEVQTLGSSTAATGRLAWASAGPGRWEGAWESDAAAVLVLQEAWAPGWEWSLDGGPWTAAALVEHMLVGAPAPAGRHSIVLRYWPVGLWTGVALSLLALCAASGVGFALSRRRRA
jgi:hypothetical protein